ncbi:hypothetical protein [Phytomonospora endophytica]|uniref:Uncharacterized protein n=1 Tax=Phytomonospora endophytica TaxID=714109 RepID=A0A841FLC6_9ACTN|nr:hypothetical protein [Phytomonospora endophytica]MBB6036745.1 hypothetical protein [Phytomonospora endophytica]GIG68221.1 hypothetical protein Pen01_45160 [Phytomonospora endophytica]
MPHQTTPSTGPYTYYVAFFVEVAGPVVDPARPWRLQSTTTQTEGPIATPADVDLLAAQLRRANPDAVTLTILSWQPLDIPSVDPE